MAAAGEVRVRRQHLERLLQQAIERAHAEKGAVHLVDIAVGAGRYMLESLKRCQSMLPPSCATSSRKISRREKRSLPAGLRTSPSFKEFLDQQALARLTPRPDIAVVSGLYELFPDNEKVLAS
jgi:hypothetical protein